MDDKVNSELKGKSQQDKRVTLILLIGSLFLIIYVVQLMGWHKPKNRTTKSYILKCENDSLSLCQYQPGKNHISSIPWDLTPFFFKKMPINSADREALMTIKGVGPKLAENILQYRLEYGPLKHSSDLLRIDGIGPKRVEYFKKMFDFGNEL